MMKPINGKQIKAAEENLEILFPHVYMYLDEKRLYTLKQQSVLAQISIL